MWLTFICGWPRDRRVGLHLNHLLIAFWRKRIWSQHPIMWWLKPRMSSKTKRRLSTKCGKRILPTSKSLVRVGIICPRSWTITAAISSQGNCARRCALKMWRIPSNWRKRRLAVTGRLFDTSLVCSAITDHAISLVIWLIGCKKTKWIMCAVRRSIPKLRVKSSDGTKPWKTASFWKTIICPATLNSRSRHSSSITITIFTTKVWATSHQRMSTADETKTSSEKGKRSKNRQSKIAACNIKSKLHNQTQSGPEPPCFKQLSCPKLFDDEQFVDARNTPCPLQPSLIWQHRLNCAGLYTTAEADVIQFVMKPSYWSAFTQDSEPRKSLRSQWATYLMRTVLFAHSSS